MKGIEGKLGKIGEKPDGHCPPTEILAVTIYKLN
jgi:hypothetical protein